MQMTRWTIDSRIVWNENRMILPIPLWYRFEDWAFSFSPPLMPHLTQLYKWVPGYRQWWKCECLVVVRNCCLARMLPGEAELVSEWTGLPGRAKRVQRFERSNGLDTALYKNYLYITMDLISFTKVAREADVISFRLVYSSNITVCEAIALSKGEINIKTSRSFFAAQLRAFRESGNYRLAASSWRHAAEFWRVPSPIVHAVPQFSHSWKGRHDI